MSLSVLLNSFHSHKSESPTYIRISPRKDGITAKIKCLNPHVSLKRKLKSSAIISLILPKLRRCNYSSIAYYPKQVNLIDLPIEVISNILSFLDYKSIQKLSRTCQKIYKICQNDPVWGQLLFTDFSILETSNHSRIYQNHLQLRQNWNTGKVQTKFMQGHSSSIYCMDWIDTNTIVSGSKDRSLKVWNCTQGRCTQAIEQAHQGSILCLKVFNKNLLVTGSSDKTCIVWRLNGMTATHCFRGHEDSVLDVCGMDRLVITASRDRTVRVWDLDTSREQRQLVGHRGAINAIEPIGRDRLATASSDTTIKIWNVHTGACVLTIKAKQGLAVVRYNQKHLFSGGLNGKINVWDVQTGNCVQTLIGHVGMIRTMDYIEGKLVSGSYDRTIKVWDLKTGTCMLSFQSGHSDWIFHVLSSKTKIISCGQENRIMMIDFGSNLKLVS